LSEVGKEVLKPTVLRPGTRRTTSDVALLSPVEVAVMKSIVACVAAIVLTLSLASSVKAQF
jgi:hypothetical protein